MLADRRSALINRHFITHGPGALAALVILLPRVANAIGASAHARRVSGDYVPGKRDCGKRSRLRQFVTTRW
jgi:hypothetical protein